MIFVPHIIRCADNISIPVDISSASADDIAATHGSPSWQTDLDSPYLSNPDVSKYAMKAPNGELIALAAYKISGRKTYVYILYAESAPHSNATITGKVERKYSGIGAVLLAFGIKYSIDNGCRGDIVFDAKTDELARHYAEVFSAKRISSISSGGPKRFMLADEDAWLLFQNILRRRLKNMKQNDPTYVIDELAERAGGYFAMPTQDDIAYTDLLFDVCRQFGIHYYSATPKEKAFVEEVTRVTWAKEQETLTGVKQDIPPAFSA